MVPFVCNMRRRRVTSPFTTFPDLAPYVISHALDDRFPAGVLASRLATQNRQHPKRDKRSTVN
jgi:hypothetical protein